MINNTEQWNTRYLTGDTPWETGASNQEMQRIFNHYIPKGQAVLEIGSGLGTNAQWLAQAGYKVTGIDVSAEAVAQAQQKAARDGLKIDYAQCDFLREWEQIIPHAVIFDCAVLHLFSERNQRQEFVDCVSHVCSAGGYWLNISCSKDEAEAIYSATGIKPPPVVSLQEIVEVAEPMFEVLEIRRSKFNVDRVEQGKAQFNAWTCVFRKR